VQSRRQDDFLREDCLQGFARNERLGRTEAQEGCRRPELVQRFLEEAQIAGKLQHPEIVRVTTWTRARTGDYSWS
jgi:hypothetical protein